MKYIFLISFLLLLGCDQSQKKTSEIKITPNIEIPEDQKKFIEYFDKAKTQALNAQNAQNDMQLGGYKSERDKSICLYFEKRKNLKISNWAGKIIKLGANRDGQGILEIDIGKNLIIKTNTISVLDIDENTILDPVSPLFKKLSSSFAQGSIVRFSGQFKKPSEYADESGCIKNMSYRTSLEKNISNPELLFEFYDVVKYEETSQLKSDCKLSSKTKMICYDQITKATYQCALKDMGDLAMKRCKIFIEESNDLCCRKDLKIENIESEMLKAMEDINNEKIKEFSKGN